MAHPSRAAYAERLQKRLSAGAIIYDPEPDAAPSPWRTARLAWGSTPRNASHRLVIQEDAIPCTGFPGHAKRALEAQPNAAVSFFCNWLGFVIGRAQQEAMEKCYAWAALPPYGWYPTVALALPRALALDLGDWQVERPIVADDAIIAQWAAARRVRILQTAPSLVDHDELAPSLMKTSPRYQDRGACCFAGKFAHRIDWSRGP